MSDLMTLLFLHYTADAPMKRPAETNEEAERCYQRLISLVGVDEAIEIWDTITGEVAPDEELCFQAGVKVGFALAAELLAGWLTTG